MTKEFVLTTESGSTYRVIDHTHLFKMDHWLTHKEGEHKQYAILCFGNFRELRAGALLGGNLEAVRQNTKHVLLRILEKEIGKAITSKSCIGKTMVYVSESDFKVALDIINKSKEAEVKNAKLEEARLWRELATYAGNTTKIVSVTEVK